jgi:hypothetical protein
MQDIYSCLLWVYGQYYIFSCFGFGVFTKQTAWRQYFSQKGTVSRNICTYNILYFQQSLRSTITCWHRYFLGRMFKRPQQIPSTYMYTVWTLWWRPRTDLGQKHRNFHHNLGKSVLQAIIRCTPTLKGSVSRNFSGPFLACMDRSKSV